MTLASDGQGADWLAVCRRATKGVQAALARYPEAAQRAVTTGRGEGGDLALAIDRAAEDAIFAELEALPFGLLAISEERGELTLGGGGPLRVVIDPIDGSVNAKRRLPVFAVSIAVADGPGMGDVRWGYVHDLGSGEEWWAERGGGAYLDGVRLSPPPQDGRLEVLALEASTPQRLAAAARFINESTAYRIRVIGSIALSLCWLAADRVDGMLSLGPSRSVDAAAAQLVVREAGASVAFPDVSDDLATVPLDLAMRSRVVAGSATTLARLLERIGPVGAWETSGA